MDTVLKPIAFIHTDFPSKFGIPRQGNLVPELKAMLVFEKEYRTPDALRGIEEYSHLWLIWGFSENAGKQWSPTVRPPRLGGNTRVGVFATRSPFRPNPIGLSLVALEEVRHTEKYGDVLIVSGADLMDQPRVYDIKPYLPHIEAVPDAAAGFAGRVKDYALKVSCPDELLYKLPEEKREALLAVLSEDPRPSYQNDEMRVYGFGFAGYEIKFRVKGDTLLVEKVEKLS